MIELKVGAGPVGKNHGVAYNAWYIHYWLTLSQCSKDIAIGILVRLTLRLAAQLRHIMIGVSYEDLAIAGSGGVAAALHATVGVDAKLVSISTEVKVGLRLMIALHFNPRPPNLGSRRVPNCILEHLLAAIPAPDASDLMAAQIEPHPPQPPPPQPPPHPP